MTSSRINALQPIFGPYLETSKWLNGIGNRLVIHKNIASSDDKKVEKLKIERRESLLGLAQVVSIGITPCLAIFLMLL